MANSCTLNRYNPTQYRALRRLIVSWTKMGVNERNNRIYSIYDPHDAAQIIEAVDKGEFNESWKVIEEITPVQDGKPLETDTIFDSPNTSRSIRSYFAGNNTGGIRAYENLLTEFRNEIISRLIYDKQTNTSYNLNANNAGLTLLNEQLWKYKMELARRLGLYLGLDVSWTQNKSLYDREYTRRLFEVINTFESVKETRSDWTNYYKDFVVLKNFDKLLKERFNIVSIKSGYGEDTKGISMYNHTGAVAPLDKSWSTKEDADISDYTSAITKELLEYLPEVDAAGRDIVGSAITFNGFNRVVTRLKDYVENEPNVRADIKAELDKGANADWDTIIDYYVEHLNGFGSKRIINEKYKNIVVSKLRGIQKYILGKNAQLPLEYKKIFMAQINKTVDVQYIQYTRTFNYNTHRYEIKAKNLQDDFIHIQSIALQNSIKTAVYRFRNNDAFFRNLLTKYDIKVNKDSIVFGTNGNNRLFKTEKTINVTRKNNGNFLFRLEKNQNFDDLLDSAVVEFIEDVLQINLPSDWKQYLNVLPSYFNLFDIFSNALCYTLYAPYNITNKKDYDYEGALIQTWKYEQDFAITAKYLSYVYGSGVLNVLKNSKHNNLPLYQLGSYMYDFKALVRLFQSGKSSNVDPTSNAKNVFYDNPFVIDPDIVGRTYVRSEFVNGNKQKESRELTFAEVVQLAVIDDYYNNLMGEGVFMLQPIVYADKRTHYLVEFDTSRMTLGPTQNVKSVLQDIGSRFNAKESEKLLQDYIARYRRSKIKKQLINLIRRYEQAYGKRWSYTRNKETVAVDEYADWKTVSGVIAEIESLLRNETVSSLRDRFTVSQFYEEFDLNTKGKVLKINETLKKNGELYWDYDPYRNSTTEAFHERIEREKIKFVQDLLGSDFNLTALRDSKLLSFFGKIRANSGQTEFASWYDSISRTMSLFKIKDKNGNYRNDVNITTLDPTQFTVVLNPILNSYFWAELTLSPAYSDIVFGDTAGYASGYGNEADVNFHEYAEASRLVAQCKRTMVGGSTRHSLLQGLPHGVNSEINVAVIEDAKGEAFNPMGEKDSSIKTHDGSGMISPFYYRMAQESYVDARPEGDVEKSIWTVTDQETGVLTELKWAAYVLNNLKRRESQNPADQSAERLFKKMHSRPINTIVAANINFSRVYNPNGDGSYNNDRTITNYTYYWDQLNDTYWRIDKIENNNDGTATVLETEVNAKGAVLNTTRQRRQNIRTVYDLDQLFGGAYNMSLDPSKKILRWAEDNITAIHNLMGIYQDLKDSIIAYAINTSAIKVGMRQVNNFKNVYNETSQLKTFRLSTRFGGIQMDASHDVESGHVTEMSQMISSLVQAGFSVDLVNEIYSDIGQIVSVSNAELNNALENKDKEKTYKILGKALLDSFAKSTRSGLGLVESFITLAEEGFRKNNINVKIPFSSPDVKNAFVTTVIAELNKSGIRRKYDGIAGILTPSDGMMMYYTWPGENGVLNYKEFVNALYHGTDEIGRTAQLVRQMYLNEVGRRFSTETEAKTQFLNDIFNRVVMSVSNLDGTQVLNPTIINIQSTHDLDFYDTVVFKRTDESWNNATVIRLDQIAKYDYIKNQLEEPDIQYRVWTAKPKDLLQSRTKFSVDFAGQKVQFDTYDLDLIRANFYLADLQNLLSGKYDKSSMSKGWMNVNSIVTVLQSVFGDSRLFDEVPTIGLNSAGQPVLATSNSLKNLLTTIEINYEDPNYNILNDTSLQPIVADWLNWINQEITNSEKRAQAVSTALSDIKKGRTPKIELRVNGFKFDTISDVNVLGGQVMMGAINREKLGIPPGTTINEIKRQRELFFSRRIQEQTRFPSLRDQSMKYDGVGYTKDGKKVLFLVGTIEQNEKMLNKTHSTSDFQIINNSVYYNDEELCAASIDLMFQAFEDDGENYYVINVPNADAINELSKTGWLTKTRLNWTPNNWRKLLQATNPELFDAEGTFKEDSFYEIHVSENWETDKIDFELNSKNWNSVNENEIAKYFNLREEIAYEKWVRDLSSRRYESFLIQLRLIAARIPTQSMQSFMPLEVVAFTESETNDVYIPKSLIWLEGADYDIDKEYMMGWSLNENGVIPTLSSLDRYKAYSIRELLNLPIPKNRTFSYANTTNQDLSNTFIVDETRLEALINSDKNLDLISEILNSGKTDVSFADYNQETFFVGRRRISPKTYERVKRKLLRRLNEHESSNKRGNNLDLALRNRVVQGIFNVILDPINQVNLQKPITMDHGKKIAQRSPIANAEKIMTFDNPATKFRMQIQNMIGREVIGIGAVSLKAFFSATLYYNTQIQKLNNILGRNTETEITLDEFAEVWNTITDLTFDAKFQNNVELRTLSNVYLEPILELLNDNRKWKIILLPNTQRNQFVQNYIQNGVFSLEGFFNEKYFSSTNAGAIQRITEIIESSDNQGVTLAQFNEVWALINSLTPEEDESRPRIDAQSIIDALQHKSEWKELKIPETTYNQKLQSSLGNFFENGMFLLGELFQHLNTVASRNDAPLNLSEVVSLATDNAKELVLAKINATTKFADVYTYLMFTGESFEDIANFMISDIFNLVSRYANENAFDTNTKSTKLLDTIKFVLNESTLPVIDNATFNNIVLHSNYHVDGVTRNFNGVAHSLLDKILLVNHQNDPKPENRGIFVNQTFTNLISRILKIYKSNAVVNTGEIYNFLEALKQPWGSVNGISGETRQLIVKTILDHLNDPKEGKELRKLFLQVIEQNFERSQKNKKTSYQTEDFQDYDVSYEEESYDPELEDEVSDNAYRTLSNVGFKMEGITDDQYRLLYYYVKELVFKKQDALNEILSKSPDAADRLVEFRNKIIPGAREMQILGRILGINQGMHTSDYQEYSWIKNIESEINRIYVNAGKNTEFIPFDFLRFMDDEVFRNKQIQQYEQVKSTFNILKVLTTSKNFFEMLKLLSTARKAISQSAAVVFERKLANEVIETDERESVTIKGTEVPLTIRAHDTTSMTQKEFSEISKYANEVILFNWILTLRKSITVPKGFGYYTQKGDMNSVMDDFMDIDLNNVHGIATFKRWVETVVIPKLQETYRDNSFLRALKMDFDRNSKMKMIQTYYTIPINMNRIKDDEKTQMLYDTYLEGFSQIVHKRLPDLYNNFSVANSDVMKDWTVGDILFLYNAVVHKNTLSSRSLSKFFVDTNIENEYGIVRNYHEFYSALDNGDIPLSTLSYDINDLKFRLSGPDTSYKFKVYDVYEGHQFVKVEFVNNPKLTQRVHRNAFFTDNPFNMPILLRNTPRVVINQRSLVSEFNKDHRVGMNSTEAIYEIANSFKELVPRAHRDKIVIINNNELREMYKASQNGQRTPISFGSKIVLDRMQNSKAFVYEGKIYINIDNATVSSPIHEYMHLILGTMKYGDEDSRNKFYDMLNAIRQTDQYQEKADSLRQFDHYRNLQGSDFQEEVLVHLLEDAFYQGFEQSYGKENVPMNQLKNRVTEAIWNLLKIDPNELANIQSNESIFDDLGQTSIFDLLVYFSSKLFTDTSAIDNSKIALNQKIANIKSNMAKAKQITWDDC